jgi:hypothetical protein
MVVAASRFNLTGCLTAAAAIEAELSQLTTDLTEAQFHAPTRTGGWSMGYCIEHLVLTGHAFLPKWDMALREAVATNSNSDAPFKYAWWQRTILHYAEDSSKLKHKAAPCFVPYSRHSIGETTRRFVEMHQQLMQRVLQSRGLDVMQARVQSPFISWIRYPLGFSFDLALAHERRHLRQAWQVRRQLADMF